MTDAEALERTKFVQHTATRGARRRLTPEEELEVTRLYAETDAPVSEISQRYGIAESRVYRVAQRHGAISLVRSSRRTCRSVWTRSSADATSCSQNLAVSLATVTGSARARACRLGRVRRGGADLHSGLHS
jgi:transposase-like protein